MRKYIAEFIGTFALTFAGCSAIASDSIYDTGLGTLGISLAFGLVIMAMIYSYGNVSGAHFNPAVTIAFLLSKKIGIKDTFLYIASQILGALFGASLVKLFFSDSLLLAVTNPSISGFGAFAFETIITFILMSVILNVSTGHLEKGIMAGIAIGGTVALAALFGGPISGASMNPARSIGPAIISGDIENLWVYITAPVLGASLAVPIYRMVQSRDNVIKKDSH